MDLERLERLFALMRSAGVLFYQEGDLVVQLGEAPRFPPAEDEKQPDAPEKDVDGPRRNPLLRHPSLGL